MTEAQMLEYGTAPAKANKKTKTMKKELTKEQIAKLNEWLPKEALTKRFDGMTNIAPWAVTERLNEVFGVGKWIPRTEFVNAFDKGNPENMPHIVTKNTLEIPEYGIYLESWGGNTNTKDIGDAYKGSQTDSLSKMASWLGIGLGVWKGEYSHNTPDFLWDSSKAVKVFNYVVSDSKATVAALKRYGARTVDEITKEQYEGLYEELKQKKLIK